MQPQLAGRSGPSTAQCRGNWRDLGHPLAGPTRESAGAALFIEGDVLYAAMPASIRGAPRVERMEGYLFADDEVGQELWAALAVRAQAGVAVRVHLDAAGALGVGAHSLAQYRLQLGVAVKCFHRWTWRQPLRYRRRNHRKLLVVDNEIADARRFQLAAAASRFALAHPAVVSCVPAARSTHEPSQAVHWFETPVPQE